MTTTHRITLAAAAIAAVALPAAAPDVADAKGCGSVSAAGIGFRVTALGPTSCAFARNVGRAAAVKVAADAGSSFTVRAFSPALGANVRMRCGVKQSGRAGFSCKGGNGARVALY